MLLLIEICRFIENMQVADSMYGWLPAYGTETALQSSEEDSQPTQRPATARTGRGNGAKEKVKKGLIFTFLCHIVIVTGLHTPFTLVMCPMGRHF